MTRASILLMCLCIVGPALAQGGRLVDPTRPPTVGTQAVPDAEGVPPQGPQLQSVLISPARRVAVISGTTVALGGRYGEATVSAINEASVLLQYRNGRRTLQLLPGVTKRERRARLREPSHRGSPR
jgi:MSHA biogenesis protein MshK